MVVAALEDKSRPQRYRQAELLRHIQLDPRGKRITAYLYARVPDPETFEGRSDRVSAALRADGVEWSCPALTEFRRRLSSNDDNYQPLLMVPPAEEFARICDITRDVTAGVSDGRPGVSMERIHRQLLLEISHHQVLEAWNALPPLAPETRIPFLRGAMENLGVDHIECPELEELLVQVPAIQPGGIQLPGMPGVRIVDPPVPAAR